jgi:hypothetical protein
MNWGTKIFIALGIFMAGIVAAGVYMVSQDNDSLVETDYYEKGISYDETYDRRQNLINERAEPKIELVNDSLVIHFKHRGNKGQILFRKPSDKDQDTQIDFQTAADSYRLALPNISSGNCDLVLIWQSNGIPFQFEKTLYLE